MILEPKSHMDHAHMLEIDLGQYFWSIFGFSMSYMQPTMNPRGYLVVKQAENLRESTCILELVRGVIGEFGFKANGALSSA